MTSAQLYVNTNKQGAPVRQMIFSHSLTHLARYFAQIHTRTQMGDDTRRERFKQKAIFGEC